MICRLLRLALEVLLDDITPECLCHLWRCSISTSPHINCTCTSLEHHKLPFALHNNLYKVLFAPLALQKTFPFSRIVSYPINDMFGFTRTTPGHSSRSTRRHHHTTTTTTPRRGFFVQRSKYCLPTPCSLCLSCSRNRLGHSPYYPYRPQSRINGKLTSTFLTPSY